MTSAKEYRAKALEHINQAENALNVVTDKPVPVETMHAASTFALAQNELAKNVSAPRRAD